MASYAGGVSPNVWQATVVQQTYTQLASERRQVKEAALEELRQNPTDVAALIKFLSATNRVDELVESVTQAASDERTIFTKMVDLLVGGVSSWLIPPDQIPTMVEELLVEGTDHKVEDRLREINAFLARKAKPLVLELIAKLKEKELPAEERQKKEESVAYLSRCLPELDISKEDRDLLARAAANHYQTASSQSHQAPFPTYMAGAPMFVQSLADRKIVQLERDLQTSQEASLRVQEAVLMVLGQVEQLSTNPIWALANMPRVVQDVSQKFQAAAGQWEVLTLKQVLAKHEAFVLTLNERSSTDVKSFVDLARMLNSVESAERQMHSQTLAITMRAFSCCRSLLTVMGYMPLVPAISSGMTALVASMEGQIEKMHASSIQLGLEVEEEISVAGVDAEMLAQLEDDESERPIPEEPYQAESADMSAMRQEGEQLFSQAADLWTRMQAALAR